MTHTARISTLARRWYTVMKSDLEGVNSFFPEMPEVVIKDIFYGDQDKIPRTPAICIEPGTKRRTWPPLPTLQSQNDFEIHFLIYHVRMDASTQEAKMQADLLGDLIEEYINISHTRLKDADDNDLLIHGHVVESDPGYINRGTSRWHATNITWRGLSKTLITVAG